MTLYTLRKVQMHCVVVASVVYNFYTFDRFQSQRARFIYIATFLFSCKKQGKCKCRRSDNDNFLRVLIAVYLAAREELS